MVLIKRHIIGLADAFLEVHFIGCRDFVLIQRLKGSVGTFGAIVIVGSPLALMQLRSGEKLAFLKQIHPFRPILTAVALTHIVSRVTAFTEGVVILIGGTVGRVVLALIGLGVDVVISGAAVSELQSVAVIADLAGLGSVVPTVAAGLDVQCVVVDALLVDQNLSVQTTDRIGLICHIGSENAFSALHCGFVVENCAILDSEVNLVVGVDHAISGEACGDASAVEERSGNLGTSD